MSYETRCQFFSKILLHYFRDNLDEGKGQARIQGGAPLFLGDFFKYFKQTTDQDKTPTQ